MAARRWIRWGLGAVLAAVPLTAAAQFEPPDPGKAREAGLPTASLPELIAQIIQWALILVGVIALGYIVYGGFLYITAGGDEGKIETAKTTIIYAVIGMVVIGLAYAVVEFVVRALLGR